VEKDAALLGVHLLLAPPCAKRTSHLDPHLRLTANCSHSSLMVNLPLLARVTNFSLIPAVGVVSKA
jgi:hypothetical protein